MADYIEREAAIGKADKFAHIHHANRHEETAEAFLMFVQELKFLPAANVKPAIYGKWISANGNIVPLDRNGCTTESVWCSKCGEWLTASDEYGVKGCWCSNCGADMRGNNNEHTD